VNGPARELATRALARFAATAVASALLAGCALPMLQRSDRYGICTVGVVEKFDSAAFRPNPLADPVGGPLRGAAGGALYGLQGGAAAAIVFVPIFATVGAISGAACGAGASAHPDADARFQAILAEADGHVFARALSAAAAANAPSDACRTRTVQTGAVGTPDAVVEVETLAIGMGCPYGRQRLWTLTQWRVLGGADGRELANTRTYCDYPSPLEFGDWFTDTGRARAEIEHVLATTGQRIGEQMFAPKTLTECRYR
jgi:hypothetical protein